MDLKIGGIGGAALVVGLTIGSVIKEDTTVEAKQMASNLTGIPIELMDKAVREESNLDVKTVPAHSVEYIKDTIIGKDTIKVKKTVIMDEQTIWNQDVNFGHWIRWYPGDSTCLKMLVCYSADTGGVIKERAFYPGKGVIEKYNGVAVKVSYKLEMIPLYGTKTR